MTAAEDRAERENLAEGGLAARVARLTQALRDGSEGLVVRELIADCGPSDTMELGGQTVEVWPITMGYVPQRNTSGRSRDKVWTATVDYDPAAPGGLRREFWARGGARGMVALPDGTGAGDVVESAADAVNSRGKRTESRDYYRVLAVTDDALLIAAAGQPSAKSRGVDSGKILAKVLAAYVRWVEGTPEREAAAEAAAAEARAAAREKAAAEEAARERREQRAADLAAVLVGDHGAPVLATARVMAWDHPRLRAKGRDAERVPPVELLADGAPAPGVEVIEGSVDLTADGRLRSGVTVRARMGVRMARLLGLDHEAIDDARAQAEAEVARLEAQLATVQAELEAARARLVRA